MFQGPQPTGAILGSILVEDEEITGSSAGPPPMIGDQNACHETEAKQGGKTSTESAK